MGLSTGQRAILFFGGGFNCAQSVLAAFGPITGLDRETALRAAAAFGAGMGRQGEICGAVTGAMLVIGLKYGKVTPEDDGAKERTYYLVQEFAERFRNRNGSILCRELLGCDLSTPGGLKEARKQKVFELVCPGFIKDSIEILEKIL